MPHRAHLASLYARDHAGKRPAGDSQLAPYSRPYERLLTACTITPGDLTYSAGYLARKVSAAGGRPFTSLSMLQAFTRRVTWSRPRDCWNVFFDVEERLSHQAAAADLEYPLESEALWVNDHIGQGRPKPAAMTPYSNSLERILTACKVSAEDATNLMIHLSDMASQQGGRVVTALQMLEAVVRRIDWTSGKRICWPIMDDAEAHMEAGGP